MPAIREEAINYAKSNSDRFLNELIEFTAIPSISTAPESRGDTRKAAEWLLNRLKSIGLDNAQLFETAGHPVVYGEKLTAGDAAPTVLIYGHYDVQPAEPIEKWTKKPFTPEVHNDSLYGRGATDMKGPVMASANAVESVLAHGDLPVNVKFMIEGEEEIGSPNLAEFINAKKDMLACDVALNPDTGMLGIDLPTITYALRGLAYFELNIYGPSQDLHSGVFGGAVHNPAQVLTELIAGMHDEKGHITLPGFYDSVIDLTDEERQQLSRLPMQDDFYFENTGAPALFGEEGYTSVERTGARPTLEVNGLLSGFTGKGSKTVLPAAAMAKISCRLVPEQDPDEVYEQLKTYLEANAPDTVTWELEPLAGGIATLSEIDSKGVQAYSKAVNEVWGIDPLFKREGGSVPVVMLFQSVLKVDSVNMGVAMPEDNMHGPDEKVHIPSWEKVTQAIIHFFYNLEK